jgi:sugar lactone lactonase YvrE
MRVIDLHLERRAFPELGLMQHDRQVIGECMVTRTMLARASVKIVLAASFLGAAQNSSQARDFRQVGPPMETVKTFGDDFRLVGIGVSAKGRVFATAPSSEVRSRFSMVEVDPRTGVVTPYPDVAWNNFSEQRDGKSQWISVQALWVDKAGHLWALDSSLSNVDQERLPPKLVEFDLPSNRVIRQYDFKGVVSSKDSLNDVRVDNLNDYAYLTNAGNKGSLVVLNLKTGEVRQVLVGDRSTFADPNQHLMIGSEVALRPNGSIVATHADGIALSPDAQWLYYRPLTDHNYWRVPTAALRDAKLTGAQLSGKVEYLGSSVLSGGLIMDANSTLYGGDLEHHTVVAMTMTPDQKLRSEILVSDPSKLSWADGFAISGGYLYIADSHLWEVAFKNNLPRSGPFTIFKVKLPRQS